MLVEPFSKERCYERGKDAELPLAEDGVEESWVDTKHYVFGNAKVNLATRGEAGATHRLHPKVGREMVDFSANVPCGERGVNNNLDRSGSHEGLFVCKEFKTERAVLLHLEGKVIGVTAAHFVQGITVITKFLDKIEDNMGSTFVCGSD
jgi:hypothetical protein